MTVALAAALQESNLLNLPYGDRDSLGLFQQRPSQGWGTAAQILDPAYAASAFYARLVDVPGWESLPVTQAAQLVQSSADPGAYASGSRRPNHWPSPSPVSARLRSAVSSVRSAEPSPPRRLWRRRQRPSWEGTCRALRRPRRDGRPRLGGGPRLQLPRSKRVLCGTDVAVALG